ncbi:MAG: ester cyclase [Acidobacteria bacterium]|nr:ester cyclase [Acidobacteriota bacterium]
MTPEQIARRYYQLFNDRRFTEAEELVDAQAVFHYLPTRQRLVGRAGYRALAAAWLTAFEDAHLEIRSVRVINEQTVEVDFLGRGTHTGDLVLGDALTIPATGQSAQLPFRERVTVRDALILEVQLDFDVQQMKKKLLE